MPMPLLFTLFGNCSVYGFLRTVFKVSLTVCSNSFSFFGICLRETFALLSVLFICFFKVSGSGMPGVGVAPFGTGVLPMVFGSGIPGVGFPSGVMGLV